MTKKVFAVVLLTIMLFTLMACSRNNGGSDTTLSSVNTTPSVGIPSTNTSAPPASEKSTVNSTFSTLSEGLKIHFGGYDWLILDVTNGMALVLSDKIIEGKPYHSNQTDSITWGDCSLRQYLNEDFFDETFSSEEKEAIAESTIPNRIQTTDLKSEGLDTIDRVFLLSIDEVQKYFPENSSRIAQYADTGVRDMWWLRSPGGSLREAAGVGNNGSIFGTFSAFLTSGVRPAMWLIIENIKDIQLIPATDDSSVSAENPSAIPSSSSADISSSAESSASEPVPIVGKFDFYGNTAGNLANGGHAAMHDRKIFYSHGEYVYSPSSSTLMYSGIFSMNTDGSDLIKICDDKAYQLNVIGDYIYYINYGDNLKIYRIKTDGSDRNVVSDEYTNCLSAFNNKIYCAQSGGIYSMNTDGSQRVLLHEGSPLLFNFNVVNEKIFYIENGYASRDIYCMDTEGNDWQSITTNEYIVFMNVVDDFIYFCGQGNGLYRMDTDGTNRIELYSDYLGSCFNVSENNIFLNKAYLYAINTSGQDLRQLSDFSIMITGSINVVGDTIFVMDSKNYSPYRMSIDGSNVQLLNWW